MTETDPNLACGAEAGRRHGLTGLDLNHFANGFAEGFETRPKVASLDPPALVAAERRRIARILAHPVSVGSEQLRTHIAFNSDLTAEQAIALLDTAAQIQASEQIASEMYAERAERVKQLRERRARRAG
ncbi:MAG: hypothetical protein GEV05_28650 [Betaproteobacteria bacterium]|nr:hypothetical protein [Betaproteobacteria bacterium]